jgi:hypothetical protein
MDHLQLLIDELCTPKRDFDNAGKVKVESKKDLAKPNRTGGAQPSPNLADAFVMAFANLQAWRCVPAFAGFAAFGWCSIDHRILRSPAVEPHNPLANLQPSTR